jgi:hypothetical protein
MCAKVLATLSQLVCALQVGTVLAVLKAACRKTMKRARPA